ncbi:MAG: peptidase domain-containing ABC transporter, partial [Nitratireductor sp.]
MNAHVNSSDQSVRESFENECVEFREEMSEHIASCMQRIADVWSQSSVGFTRKFDSRVGDEEMPSMERLSAFANELEVDLKFTETKIEKIKAEQFPCILMLNTGKGVIAKSSDGKQVTLLVGMEDINVSLSSLKALCCNIAITVHPKTEVGVKDVLSPEIEKNEDAAISKKSGLKKLTSLILSENKRLLFQLFLTATVNNVVMVVLPLFIMIVYDRVIPHSALETLWALAIGVFLVLAIDVAIRYVRLVLVDAIGFSASTKLQTRLYDRLINARMNSAPKSVADWTSAFRDIESASTLIPSLMISILVDIPFVVLVLLLVSSMAGSVVWAPIIGIMLITAWIAISQRMLLRVSKQDNDFQNKKMNDFAETVNSLRTIKAVGAQHSRLGRFERLIDSSTHSSHQSRLHSLMPSQVTMIAVQAVIVSAVIIGVYRISEGQMTVGALAASTLLVGRVLLPVSNLMSLFARSIQVSKSITRVFELLELPQEKAGDAFRSGGISKGHIDLKNASFQYPDTELACLNNVSLSIKPGEKVALVGRTGCGKSTLLKLLVRFYDPISGSYNIDFADSRQVSPDTIRKAFAYMPQEAELFDG